MHILIETFYYVLKLILIPNEADNRTAESIFFQNFRLAIIIRVVSYRTVKQIDYYLQINMF
ncbi:hypothetical protein N007_08975 [Alicyclobacillus acidoterrestris ATCC 49025]|nr:hypothetical protein N007_08975 [Alicyclobacillus acidoterrestris ATCC 49025]